MSYKDTCNRRINWLIYAGPELAGATGINSALLELGPRDKLIGWDRDTKTSNLGHVANHYRFCLIKHIPNLGSQVLSILEKEAPKDWLAHYGEELWLLETLVKPPWTGVVYRAANWQYIGQTAGFSFSKAPIKLWQKESGRRGELARQNPKEAVRRYAVGQEYYHVQKEGVPKLIFIKPLIRKWKEKLNAAGNGKVEEELKAREEGYTQSLLVS